MSDQPSVEPAFDIDLAECSPLPGDKIVVRVQGRVRGRRRLPEGPAMLVVEVDGCRHRFPAVPQSRRARLRRPGAWSASFALPAWLEARLEHTATVWIGDTAISLPGIARPQEQPAELDGAEASPPAPPSDIEPAAEPAAEPSQPEPVSTGAGDEHTVSALRAELQARATAEARLGGELADRQAELEASAANQAGLERAHEELRREFEALRGLVQQQAAQRAGVESKAAVLAAQVAEVQEQVTELAAARDGLAGEREQLEQEIGALRSELAASAIAGEAARSEAAGLRAELERLGGELAAAREALGARDGGIDEAEALLAEARALTASLREQ